MLFGRDFQFQIPTKIYFGEEKVNSIGQIVKEWGWKKILIVTDPIMVDLGVIKQITHYLKETKISYEVFSEVKPDPQISVVREVSELQSTFLADGILAIGGGSSIDTGKAAAFTATNFKDIKEYEGHNKIENDSLPLIVVPTTAGTGAEVTNACVVTDEKSGNKISIRSSKIIPDGAILDSTLLTSLPRSVAATTGLDALAHAIEAFVSINANPVTDALAKEAIREIGLYLRPFCARRDNTEAASHMLVASSLAGMAFNWARVATCHALAHPLGGKFKIAHGMAISILLPEVMEYSFTGNLEKYAWIAEALGADVAHLTKHEAAKKAIDEVRQLREDLNIPSNVKDLGIQISKDDILKIAENALESGITAANPKDSNIQELISIIEKVS